MHRTAGKRKQKTEGIKTEATVGKKKRKWDLSPHISNYIKCKQS